MGDISNYSKEALEKKIEIKNYTRKEENGLVKITYDTVDRVGPALIGSIFGVAGAALGAAIGHTTSHSHNFDAKDGELLATYQNDAAEKLHNKGSKLLQEGKYAKAAEYYKNAYRTCSSGYQNEYVFRNSKDKAEAEVAAIDLNSQGDRLFNLGKYTEARMKYQEAYGKSQVSKEYLKYKTNRDKAEAEAGAINLNSQGESLFSLGKYDEARKKYQEAYDKSQVSNECNKYKTNRDKAEAEVDAINLNSQGESLFSLGKYDEAVCKYQEAYDKAKVMKEKDIYLINKEKTQTIMDKLSILDGLWNKAWEAEENGQSDEAEKYFHRVLSACKFNLEIFPDNLRLKQYETLVCLKMEGNKVFNEGLVFQQTGIQFFQEAQELKQKKKYALANIKFKEAKEKFIDAQNQFEKGRVSDHRFVSCIQVVQDTINQVIQSLETTEQHALSQGLQDLDVNINNVRQLKDGFCEMDSKEDREYYEQI